MNAIVAGVSPLSFVSPRAAERSTGSLANGARNSKNSRMDIHYGHNTERLKRENPTSTIAKIV